MPKKIATKANPKLWQKAKAKARRKIPKQSAVQNLLATKYYKQMGGKYKGSRSKSNLLRRWANKVKRSR